MFGRPEDWQKTEEGQVAIKQMREAFVTTELPKYLGYFRPPPRAIGIQALHPISDVKFEFFCCFHKT